VPRPFHRPVCLLVSRPPRLLPSQLRHRLVPRPSLRPVFLFSIVASTSASLFARALNSASAFTFSSVRLVFRSPLLMLNVWGSTSACVSARGSPSACTFSLGIVLLSVSNFTSARVLLIAFSSASVFTSTSGFLSVSAPRLLACKPEYGLGAQPLLRPVCRLVSCIYHCYRVT